MRCNPIESQWTSVDGFERTLRSRTLCFCKVIYQYSYFGELTHYNKTHKELIPIQKSQYRNMCYKAMPASWSVWVIDNGLSLLVDKSIPETIYRLPKIVNGLEHISIYQGWIAFSNLEIFILPSFLSHKSVHFCHYCFNSSSRHLG